MQGSPYTGAWGAAHPHQLSPWTPPNEAAPSHVPPGQGAVSWMAVQPPHGGKGWNNAGAWGACTSGYMSPEAQLLREEQVRAQTMLEHESVAHNSMKRKHAEAEQEARAWPHPHSGFRIDCTISL